MPRPPGSPAGTPTSHNSQERNGYVGLDAHLRAHAGLLKRARNLKAAFAAGEAAVGGIVEFLAGEVVARHLFKADRHFFPLFKTGTGIIETVPTS